MSEKNVIAFDLGASSGRAILGKYKEDSFEMEEIHRFENQVYEENGSLHWDISYLFSQILVGLEKACATHVIDSLAVDTWGVDFGLLDKEGNLLLKPYHYRDNRTSGMIEEVLKKIPKKELYVRTGNQILGINTLYQLMAYKKKQPELLERADCLLFMPDLFHYFLTGKKVAEKSIASTSQMFQPLKKEWNKDLLQELELPIHILPEIVSEKNVLGKVLSDYTTQDISVINVCEHDTASAVASVPAQEKFLFISCGTWSLVGTELQEAVLNEKAYHYNLTNESGIDGTTRFQKNCTGLWIVQELKRNFEEKGWHFSFAEIAEMAEKPASFSCFIDTDDERFATPSQMIEKVQRYAEETDQHVPQTPAELFRVTYESLAMKYQEIFQEIMEVVDETYTSVHIVGGGSQAEILCQMVANAANKKVIAGPAEATAIGNIATQLMAQGVFKDVDELRNWVEKMGETKEYLPKNQEEWARQFKRYKKIMAKEK